MFTNPDLPLSTNGIRVSVHEGETVDGKRFNQFVGVEDFESKVMSLFDHFLIDCFSEWAMLHDDMLRYNTPESEASFSQILGNQSVTRAIRYISFLYLYMRAFKCQSCLSPALSTQQSRRSMVVP
jgi:hypothetical protein